MSNLGRTRKGLFRVSFFNETTSECVYDVRHKWKTESSEDAFWGLMRAFFSIAQEIDVGEIETLRLSQSIEPHTHLKPRHRVCDKKFNKEHVDSDVLICCKKGLRAIGVVCFDGQVHGLKHDVCQWLAETLVSLDNLTEQSQLQVVMKECSEALLGAHGLPDDHAKSAQEDK